MNLAYGYPERLEHIQLFSFRSSRLDNFIKTFNLFHGFVSVDLSEFFSIRESGDERGHPFMLAKLMVNTTIESKHLGLW